MVSFCAFSVFFAFGESPESAVATREGRGGDAWPRELRIEARRGERSRGRVCAGDNLESQISRDHQSFCVDCDQRVLVDALYLRASGAARAPRCAAGCRTTPVHSFCWLRLFMGGPVALFMRPSVIVLIWSAMFPIATGCPSALRV